MRGGRGPERGRESGEPRGTRGMVALFFFLFFFRPGRRRRPRRGEEQRQIRGYRLADSLKAPTSTPTTRAGRARRIPSPVKRTRGNEGEQEREKRAWEGAANENAFAALARGRRKPSESNSSSLSLPSNRAPSLRFILPPPCRARGSTSKGLNQPYRKSSGICCTACSQTTNRHPFFCFFRLR